MVSGDDCFGDRRPILNIVRIHINYANKIISLEASSLSLLCYNHINFIRNSEMTN